jgi:hypothetical protein
MRKKCFQTIKFAAFNPDYVFLPHNLPGYPKNQIIVKNDTLLAL